MWANPLTRVAARSTLQSCGSIKRSSLSGGDCKGFPWSGLFLGSCYVFYREASGSREQPFKPVLITVCPITTLSQPFGIWCQCSTLICVWRNKSDINSDINPLQKTCFLHHSHLFVCLNQTKPQPLCLKYNNYKFVVAITKWIKSLSLFRSPNPPSPWRSEPVANEKLKFANGDRSHVWNKTSMWFSKAERLDVSAWNYNNNSLCWNKCRTVGHWWHLVWLLFYFNRQKRFEEEGESGVWGGLWL